MGAGIARLIRYSGNWRLQQEALRLVPGVRVATPSLLAAVLSVLRNNDALLENRVFAARALASIVCKAQGDEGCSLDIDEATAVAESILDHGCPPILEEALCGVLENRLAESDIDRTTETRYMLKTA